MMSNFDNGFKNGLTVNNIVINIPACAKVFYVSNNTVVPRRVSPGNDTTGNGSFNKPFATLAYAMTQCTAGQGDIIFIKEGHAETIADGTTTAINIAGVKVIGLGQGDKKPVFSFSATTSTIVQSGANSTLANVKLLATIDSVVAGLTITGSGCNDDIETADTSAIVEFISPIVTQATADNLTLKWKHRGFAAGDACLRGLDLVGCRDADITVDFFGIASTAVVNMRTTACDNVKIKGNFYNDSAALTKNVVNSTTSTWSVIGYDAKGAHEFAGSDDTAVAYIDSGAATATALTAALGTDGTTVTDSATTVLGAIGANSANNSFDSSTVAANADGSVLEREEYIQTDMLALPRCVASTAKSLTTGNVTIFTITGGPIKILEIVGIVTTVAQAQATSCKLQAVTTTPSATVDMSAGAVDLTGADAGASIRHINTTAILTVVTAGFVMEGNAFATNDTQFLVPVGSIQLNNASATNSGAITWYLRYVPLSPSSRVA
jgi:hypothetical protein